MPQFGALQGDLYQMSSGYKDRNPAETISKGIRLPQSEKQNDSNDDSSKQAEERSKASSVPVPEVPSARQQDNTAGIHPEAGNQAAPYRGIMQQDIDTVSTIFSMWFGDRYSLNEQERTTFERMVSASADPVDAAGRYVASVSLSKRSGLPVTDVYSNLDAIAEYYTGAEYKAGDATLPQLVDASFETLDSLDLKSQWMDLVNKKGRNDPEALQLEERIFAMDADIDAKGGGIPKNGWDKVKRDVIGSLGYTLNIASRAGLASVSTAAAMAPMVGSIAAVNPIAGAAVTFSASLYAGFMGTVAGFDRSRQLSEAEMYWNLMHLTDEEGNILQGNPETASIFAGLYGNAVGYMETMFDGITSRAGAAFSGSVARRFGLSNLATKVLTDRGVQGTLENIAYAGLDWLAGGLDEGFLQEAPQQLAETLLTAGYQKAAGIEPDISAKEMAADFFRTGLESTLVGLIYGAAGIPGTMMNNRQLSFDLRREANRSPSAEVFFERTESRRPENVSKEDYDSARAVIHGNAQAQREAIFGKSADGSVNAYMELAQEERYDTTDPETGEETSIVPDGSIYRTPDTNALYTETRDENGRRRVYAGDRNTGAVYGYAEISTDGDTLTVGSVRVRPGYEGIREELVRKAISEQRTGESSIAWEPTTEGLMSVKNQLIQNNPGGREAGLDYGADLSPSQNHDIESLSSSIRTAMPNLSREESVVAARLYSIADADGTLTSLNEGQPVRNSDTLASRYRGAADGARAIIYAGKNADFSTFYHELFHVNATQRPSEAKGLSNAIRSSMQDEASKANLRKFIEESKEIWGKAFNADDVMQHLETIPADSDASQWSRAQFEDLARLAEAYATADNSKRATLPEAIRNILRKIGEYMRKVYQTVTHTVPLPKEITEAYDAIMHKTSSSGSSHGIQYQNRNVIRQPLRENTYESAIELAKEAHPQFVEIVEDIRELTGAESEDVSVRKTFKGKKRSVEKAADDYQGDFSQILDYDGAMIQFNSIRDAENAWKAVKDEYKDRIVKEKHLSTNLGYQDFKVNLRMDNGAIAEIQFLDKNTLAVKNGIGHKIYENYRTITVLRKNGIPDLENLQAALSDWSNVEYGLSEAYTEQSGAYTNSEARRNAISSVIRQALSSALSRNQVSSESVNSLSTISLPSSEGISLETGEEVAASILNGISLISTYLKDSGIMPSTQSIDSQGNGGNLVYQGGEQYQTTEEKMKADPRNFDSEGHHLAPNGKPSNLSYEQWVTVRTPAFKEWFGDWEGAANIEWLMNSEPVATLTGDEFKVNLVDSVESFYRSLGNKIARPGLGDVSLTRHDIQSSVAHGVGRIKAIAFAAVPDVIREGREFSRTENYKGRGYDSIVIAAPISIAQEEYICEVVLNKEPNKNRFYLHEVEVKDKLQLGNQVRSYMDEKHPKRNTKAGASRLIISKLFSEGKFDSSKVVDENGEPLVVYHGTASEFSIFDRAFLGSSSQANSARIGFFFSDNQQTAEGYGRYASKAEARRLYERATELERQGKWSEAEELQLRADELSLQDSSGIVMPTFLNIRNPYIVEAYGADFRDTGNIFSEFNPEKYDGMIVHSFNDNVDGDYIADHYIVLESNQIKSIDNRGTFSSENPDIYMQAAKTPDTSDLTPEQNEKRKKAEAADTAYLSGEATDLYNFYDEYDASMDGIADADDAEEVARIYSELAIEADMEASNADASLIDEDTAPYWSDESINLLPDGSIAASEAEYEEALNSQAIPSEMEEAGLSRPSAASAENNENAADEDTTAGRPGISLSDAEDYELSWREFTDRNKPDIAYEGTDVQKDDQFIQAIQDDDTLLRYLGIIGEALYLNTRELNEDWHFSDQIQRERVKARVFDTITNTSIRNASLTALKAELSDRNLSSRMKSIVRREMADNARFYRNILSFMIGDEAMKPEELIKEAQGLDIPSRDTLDAMPIDELRALAETAEDRAIVDQIERGTLKMSGGMDEAREKEINSTLRSLAERIRSQETELRQNEQTISQLESNLDSVSSSLADRDRHIDDLIRTLRTVENIERADVRKLSGESLESYTLNSRMKAVAAELGWLNKGKYEEIEAQHTRGKTGKYEIPKAKRAAKEEYISSLMSFYPSVFEENGNQMGKLSGIKDIYSPSGFDKVQAILETRREELRAAWKDEAASYASRLANATWASLRKLSSDIDSALQKMESLQKEVDKQKKLKDRIKTNRKRQMFDARTEERWKAAKKALEAEKRYSQEIQNWKSYADWQKHEHKAQLEAVMSKAKDDAALLADWMKAKADVRISELKAEQREKRRQERLYKRIREEKEKLGRAICRPVNLNTIDYETSAEAIAAIQTLVDPHFRRDWAPDLEVNPTGEAGGGTMTIPEAIAYLQNLQEDDRNNILSILSPDLAARLSGQRNPLNDWSVEQLRQLAEQVEELRSRGREVMRAKKAFERETREKIQKAIINAVNEVARKSGRDTGDTLPGSNERIRQAQGTLAKWRSAKYITMRMQEIAQLLDGGLGHQGAAYQLLVDEKRYHQAREWRAVDSRFSKIAPLLTKKAVNELFDNVTLQFSDGLRLEYTVDRLAYLYLSQFDEDSKAAVAYGNLLTDPEKGTLLNKGRIDENGKFIPEAISPGTIIDDEELKALGDRRYAEALRVAANELESRGLMPLVEAIREDFASAENFRRLNHASIEAYNTPLKRVLNYLPIMRQDLRGDNFRNDMADALFNLNTGDFNAALDKGMTISRIAIAPRHQRGVNMSLLEVWQKSVRNQEHLIEFAQYAKKLRGVFGSNAAELISAVDKVYSPGLMKEIQGYIDIVINPFSGQPKSNLDKTLRNLRGRTGAAYLGWKLPGVVLQFCTSAWPFLQDMRPAALLRGYLKIAAGRGDVLNMIYEKSPMMKHRTMNTVVQEALERRGDISRTKAGRALDKFNEVGQLGLTWVDKTLVAGGWLGAYETALQRNLDAGMDTALADAAAVKTADDIVLRTQPAGDVTELPSLFRSRNELVKIFLQFQSSMSVIWNNLIWDNIGFARNRQFGKIIASVVSYGMAGLALGLVADGFDDDDDAKDRAQKMSYWFLTQGIESAPVFGSDISMILQRAITGEKDYYGNGTDMFPGITKIFTGIEDIIASDKPFTEGVWKVAEGAGIFAGAPVSGWKNLKRVAEEGPAALLGR